MACLWSSYVSVEERWLCCVWNSFRPVANICGAYPHLVVLGLEPWARSLPPRGSPAGLHPSPSAFRNLEVFISSLYLFSKKYQETLTDGSRRAPPLPQTLICCPVASVTPPWLVSVCGTLVGPSVPPALCKSIVPGLPPVHPGDAPRFLPAPRRSQ